jgi:hypothetical protein
MSHVTVYGTVLLLGHKTKEQQFSEAIDFR